MARIVASLLHRPNADKSKRVTRIPIGGHTEKTLLRGQTQFVAMIDEVNFIPDAPSTPEVAEEPVIIEATTPEEIAFFRANPEVFEEIVEPAPEAPRIGDEVIVQDLIKIIEEQAAEEVTPSEVIVEAEVIVDVTPVTVEVVDATPVHVEQIFVEEVKAEEVKAEEAPLEKFDYETFLSQKASEIKTALATGDHDLHLTALTKFETAGANRKNVLGYIAGRVQV